MDRDSILALFPEIEEIQSPDLQKKTILALQIAIEKGGWDQQTIHMAPVTVNWDGCKISLVDHIRDVTNMVRQSFDYLSKYYQRHNAEVDRDTVICGALLHDIGKFTEFCFKDGVAQHSDNYNLIRHPLSGAIIAAQAELPDKIVHLIAIHSFEGNQSYQTIESKLVREIDLLVFENGVCGLKKKN